MRIPSVLLPAALACCLVAPLSACSSGSGGVTGSAEPAPPASSASASSGAASSAVDLAGTTWHVQEEAGTTVHFDGAAITVAEGGHSSSYAWSAQGDQILVGGSTSTLDGPVTAPWLTGATRVERTLDGWRLRDAKGGATATLTASASAAPTTSTTLLETAVPGAGVVDAATATIEGTWTAAHDPRTAITFTGGQWRAASSCTTGAVGGRGRYRVLPGGRLLAVRTAMPMRGCPIVRGVPRIRATAISGITRAGSFRVDGDTLTLFDRAGTQLGSLVRG
jgi:hypothetical protein